MGDLWWMVGLTFICISILVAYLGCIAMGCGLFLDDALERSFGM